MDTINIYRVIEDVRVMDADATAGGTLPTRAFRHCQPVAAACGWGFYVFPPARLSFVWDGRQGVSWSFNDTAMGPILARDASGPALQYPGLAERWDRLVPDPIKGWSPPYIFRMLEPGHLVLWTGLLAQTAPGWSLNVRAPVNIPRPDGYELLEGIIASDRWFGPISPVLRLTRVHDPVTIEPHLPLVQLQPIRREAYVTKHALAMFVLGPSAVNAPQWDAAAWDRYVETVIAPQQDAARKLGTYAIAERQRIAREARR